jgi:CBS domain-containing protein
MARKIRDIMMRAPVCMAPAESAAAAARTMKAQGVGTVLVLDSGQLCGLVTDRDIAVRVLAENRDAETVRLGDICTPDFVVLGPDDDVSAAVRLVCELAVRRIPVMENGQPVGVVSTCDLTRLPFASSGPG